MLHYPEEIRRKVKEYQQRHIAWIYGIRPKVSMPEKHAFSRMFGRRNCLPTIRKPKKVYSDAEN